MGRREEIKTRTNPLTSDQKSKLRESLSGRVQLIRGGIDFVKSLIENPHDRPKNVTGEIYYHLHPIGIASRCLLEMMGVGVKDGNLVKADLYHKHSRGESNEVKAPDLGSLSLVKTDEFDAAEKKTIAIGIDSTNREIAHFTYFDTQPDYYGDQIVDEQNNYEINLHERIVRAAELIVSRAEEIVRELEKQNRTE